MIPKISDEEYARLTVDDLRKLVPSVPLDDEGYVSEPGNPIDSCEFKECWGAREDVERALYNRSNPMRECWWAS